VKRGLRFSVLLIIVSLAAPPADAHVKRFKTVSTLDVPSENDGYAQGTVSGKAKCLEGRTIQILDDNDAVVVDNVITGPGGFWKQSFAFSEGETFRARVLKRVVKKNGLHRHICKKNTSAPQTAIA
jgi:hypothetical protein